MGEEELGAELVGEEELDEVEGLKVAVAIGGVIAHPPYKKAEVRGFMGRGLGLKPNLTLWPPSAPNIAPRTPTYYIPFRDQIVAYTVPPRTEWRGWVRISPLPENNRKRDWDTGLR